MNIERINEVIVGVRATSGFNMKCHRECIGAVAGRLLGLEPGWNDGKSVRAEDSFAQFCEVPCDVAEAVCAINPPDGLCHPAWNATRQQAVRMLENFRDTGIVDWPAVLGDKPEHQDGN